MFVSFTHFGLPPAPPKWQEFCNFWLLLRIWEITKSRIFVSLSNFRLPKATKIAKIRVFRLFLRIWVANSCDFGQFLASPNATKIAKIKAVWQLLRIWEIAKSQISVSFEQFCASPKNTRNGQKVRAFWLLLRMWEIAKSPICLILSHFGIFQTT